MQSEDRIRILHILDEAKEAMDYASDITYDQFCEDGKTAKAIIRSLEVIGEAASQISKKTRGDHSEIPWEKIIGMRNRLIHGYFNIDYRVVWKTVKENLPPLIEQVQNILEQ